MQVFQGRRHTENELPVQIRTQADDGQKKASYWREIPLLVRRRGKKNTIAKVQSNRRT